VREAVSDESKLTLLGILDNRVHGILLGDLLIAAYIYTRKLIRLG
jgi:hypothetical protein